jgi:membrane protein DedA with SNARE-associated domain
VFFARWIAVVRFAAAWLAGINEMRFRQFFLFNALGAVSWGVTYGLVGYFGGSAAADAISSVGIYAAVALGLLLVAAYAYYKLRGRRASRRPGSDA